jgi:hypothetical protein
VVVRLTLRPHLTLKKIPVRGCVDPRTIVPLEELNKLKNPMNSSGIELPIYWVVI